MKQFARGCLLAAMIAGVALGCRSVGLQKEGEKERESLPAALLSTREMRSDAFTLHQQLRFSFGDRRGNLGSVIQKNCDSLDVVGLGPFNARIFSLRQVAREVDYEPEHLEVWPFPPLNILLDIHRIYLYPLAEPPPPDGVQVSSVAGMSVSEHWKSGRLMLRILTSEGGTPSERIKIEYKGGLVRDEAPPAIVLEDALRGYRLDVETVSFHNGTCVD